MNGHESVYCRADSRNNNTNEKSKRFPSKENTKTFFVKYRVEENICNKYSSTSCYSTDIIHKNRRKIEVELGRI